MWQANPISGSRRIQAELAKLGIAVSDSIIRHYRPEHRPLASVQTWKTFLQNHAQVLVAVDFFAVPTATFRVLYVFLVLAHERREILHFNITEAPSALWTAQQVVEAFPYTIPPRYLLRDRDRIYGADFVRRVEGLGVEQKRSASRSTPAKETRLPCPASSDNAFANDNPSQNWKTFLRNHPNSMVSVDFLTVVAGGKSINRPSSIATCEFAKHKMRKAKRGWKGLGLVGRIDVAEP
jgi:hypothetical protein